jgi:MFS family permease
MSSRYRELIESDDDNDDKRNDNESDAIVAGKYKSSSKNAKRKSKSIVVEEEEQSQSLIVVESKAEDSDSDDSESFEQDDQVVKITPLPKGKLFVLSIILFCEAFAVSFLFPFIGYFVEDTGQAGSREAVGYWAGLIASAFSLAQFVSAPLWGGLSDRLGRRPILLFGMASNAIVQLSFGFSTTIWMAIGSRALQGVLNGNIGVAKAYISLCTDETNQSRGMSLLGVTWGFGLIVSSSIGGFLAQPADKYAIFENVQLLIDYPYLLPCVCASALSFIGLVSGIFFLPEVGQQASASADSDDALLVDDNTGEVIAPPAESRSERAMRWLRRAPERMRLALPLDLLRDRSVLIVISCYGLVGFIYTALNEVFSLWAMSYVRAGGLDMDTNEIGIVFAISGVFLLPVNMYLYPIVDDWLGSLTVHQVCGVASIPTFMAYPLVTYLMTLDCRACMWAALMIVELSKTLCALAQFTSIMILVNNSGPIDQIGSVNGIAQSAVALTRAIAPALCSALFSWSLTNGISVLPFNHFFIFYFLALLQLLEFALAMKLPASLASRRVVQVQSIDDDQDSSQGETASNELTEEEEEEEEDQ